MQFSFPLRNTSQKKTLKGKTKTHFQFPYEKKDLCKLILLLIKLGIQKFYSFTYCHNGIYLQKSPPGTGSILHTLSNELVNTLDLSGRVMLAQTRVIARQNLSFLTYFPWIFSGAKGVCVKSPEIQYKVIWARLYALVYCF